MSQTKNYPPPPWRIQKSGAYPEYFEIVASDPANPFKILTFNGQDQTAVDTANFIVEVINTVPDIINLLESLVNNDLSYSQEDAATSIILNKLRKAMK